MKSCIGFINAQTHGSNYIYVLQNNKIEEQVEPSMHQHQDIDQTKWIDPILKINSNNYQSQLYSNMITNNSKYDTDWLKEEIKKNNNYIQRIQYFFSQSNDGNQVILTQQWLPIIPQSSNSTIAETISNKDVRLKVQFINDFLSDLAYYLNGQQETKVKQQIQILQMQAKKAKNKEEIKQYKELETQLQTDYNKLSEEYKDLECNYQKYLQTIEKINLLKHNSKLFKGMTQYTLQLLEDKNQIEEQQMNLSQIIQKQFSKSQMYKSQIQQIQNEKLYLKEQLPQQYNQNLFESQEKTYDNHKQDNSISQQKQYSSSSEQKQQYLELQSQPSQSHYITLKLIIKTQEYYIKQPMQRKYSEFLREIQKVYFQELEMENQSIIFKNLQNIVPESSNSIINKVIQNYKQQGLIEFLSDLENHINSLSEITSNQQSEIPKLQEQITKDLSQIDIINSQQQYLENEYIKLREKNKLLETIYKGLLQIIEKNTFIKEDSQIYKQMDQYTKSLIKDKQQIEDQNVKSSEEWSKYKQQDESQIKQILNLSNETLILKNEIGKQQQKSELQLEQEEYDIFQQKKQTGIRIKNSDINVDKKQELPQQIIQINSIDMHKLNQISFELRQSITFSKQEYEQQEHFQQKKKAEIRIKNNDNKFDQKNELPQQIIKTNSKEIHQLDQIQQKQFEQRLSNQDISEQLSQLSICSYCNQSCSNYIKLPCLHSYHQDCLEELGENAVVNLSSPICICTKHISIKLFTKTTKYKLLLNQQDQIFTKYRESLQLQRCKECPFFYKSNNSQQPYCPYCDI